MKKKVKKLLVPKLKGPTCAHTMFGAGNTSEWMLGILEVRWSRHVYRVRNIVVQESVVDAIVVQGPIACHRNG